MKKIIFLVVCLLSCGLYSQAQNADTAFEKGQFTEALNAYQTQAKTATGDNLYKVQLRIIASQYMLGQYMNAAKTAYNTPLPSNPLWKARFLLYRIKTAQRVKNMYREALPDADENTSELENLSNKQWEDKIFECFEQLWALRKDLINAPITQENLIIDTKNTDTLAIPTLFDFFAKRWTEELVNRDPQRPIDVRPLLTLDYHPAIPSANNREKALALMAEAAILEGKNRADARIMWQANRLLLPLEYKDSFEFKNNEQEKQQIIQLLEILSGYNTTSQQKQVGLWQRLKQKWQTSDKASYGQSYAAYRAAQQLENSGQYERAVSLCEWSLKEFGKNYYTQSCERLAQDIRQPVLNINRTGYTQDPAHTSVSFRTRNVYHVYLRVYAVTEKDLQSWHTARISNWDYLTRIEYDKIPQLLKRQPLHELTQAVTYKTPYGYTDSTVPLPNLEKRGFYAVALAYDKSFDTSKTPVEVIVLNATDLALLVTSGIEDDPTAYRVPSSSTREPVIFNIRTVDFKNGTTVPNAAIAYFENWNSPQYKDQTNEQGILALKRSIPLDRNHEYYQILPKATYKDSTAVMNSYTGFNFSVPNPVRLFVETDRAAYRPGQKVQLAVYGMERTARGFKTLSKDDKVQLEIKDANYETVFKKTLPLNNYGTTRTEFTLPQTGLLGNYRVNVSCLTDPRGNSGSTSFKVEEYKLPEYEVSLDKNAVLRYDTKTTVTGKASYYFGAPLSKATVKYTVTREYFQPRFCWWWWIPFSEKEMIAQGETKTEKDGSFRIPFTPQPGMQRNYPTNFHVEVSVYDESGRSIDASQDYKASYKTLFFAPSFTQGFYDAKTAGRLAQVKLTDVNSEPVAGKFTAEIYELENVWNKPSNDHIFKEYEYDSERMNSLEKWYAKNKEIRKVSSQTFSAKKGEEINLDIPALPEGIYKLKLQAKEADTAELIFLVSEQTSKLALPQVAIAQHETYYPGSRAKILLGAQKLKGPKYLDVYQEDKFLVHKKTLPEGTSIYSFTVQDKHRGGLYLRWVGVSDYTFYQAGTALSVPFDNKKLSLRAAVPQAVKPGQKVNWNVTAKDAKGNNVNGQLSVRIYDKALDYYAPIYPVFSLENFYPQRLSGGSLETSQAWARNTTRNDIPRPDRDYLPAPEYPSLNLLDMRFGRYRSVKGGIMLSAMKAMPTDSYVMEEAAMASTNDMAMGMDDDGGDYKAEHQTSAVSKEKSEVTPRTDFSETAYFNPMLPLQGGKAAMSFTMPQSLTSWNIMGFAITPDIDLGSFTAQTVTRKDLMVRLSLPRFWRENDKTTLVVQVTNTSAKSRTAEVTLDALLDGKEAAQHFGLTNLTRTVTVPANGNVAVTWPVSVATGVGVAKLTATLRSLQDTDAESREMPILPSKQRIAESITKALEKGTQTLQLENLLTPDPTREVSTVNLRVDPSLFLSVFNAMPQLLRPYHEDALSLINRYVPLAVINAFYEQYPDLKQAVKKLPKRNTQTPAWDSTDPARLLLLTETPWLQRSYGGATREYFMSDVFNPVQVSKTRESTEKSLLKYQTASGGFTWMPGGKPSQFITMEILSSYAQILRYGGQVPETSAKKALAWLAPFIEKNLKDAQASSYVVSDALYAAYVFTAFPQNWKEVKKAPVKKWLDYADQHAVYMTPLGKTMAAAAYFRLGEKDKANEYLDSVLSLMKSDPVTGAYFAPEAQSWLWYNDTLTTQTMTLRTLMEIRPQSDKAADLVKWLLFNRKAQCWRDTTSTAKAIYALLDYMQKRGLFNQAADYKVQWGNMQKQLHFEPFDWSDKLIWTQEAINVPATYYKAQVQKTGGMTGFATLDAVYTTANAKASPKGILNVERRYMLKYKEDGRDKVRALQPGEEIPVGSEIEVQLKLTASSAFDFVLLADPKPSGFENTELLSGWTWDALSMYQEIRDASTNFFINRVPAGTYTLRYTLRPTLAGNYHVLPAQVQSMYAPEFSAHTASDSLNVKK